MMHQDKKLKFTPSPCRPQVDLLDTTEWPSFPVLTAVRLVGRECLHIDGNGSLLRVIDGFLDNLSGSLTMSSGYRNSGGSLRLLQYLAVRESKTMDIFLRRWEVNAVTGQMGARGDLRSLKWIAEKYLPDEFLTEVVAEAASGGHLELVKWLWQNHRDMGYWGGIELSGAVRKYHNNLVDWLRTHVVLRPECAKFVIEQAAKSGNLDIVKWLYENLDIRIGEALVTAVVNDQWEVTRWFVNNGKRADLGAALNSEMLYLCPTKSGDLDMLKFLFERELVREPVKVLQVAAGYGHLPIIKWFHEEKGVMDAGNGCILAAENDQLEVLQYLHEKKMDTNGYDDALDVAASTASLDMVQWLHYNTQVQSTNRAMDAAAGQGCLEMVQWLSENRTEGCSSLAMHFAAQNDHLDVVEWLHVNRCEGCHVSTMNVAANRGNLAMVQWLHTNRHETFNLDGVMDAAATHGYLDILQWFHDNRDVGCTTAAMDGAAANGGIEIVKWLHENRSEGCTQRAMDEAAKNGHLEVVKWLHLNRSEGCTQRAMNEAAKNGHLEVVKWLHLNRNEGCSSMAMDEAARNSQLKVVKWLRRHRSLSCTPLALQWLFSNSRRLDTAVFLFEEFPDCRLFHLGSEFEVAWLEVVQWLLERTPCALDGCTLKVKSWNWHVWEWLAQNGWEQDVKHEAFTFWNRQ